ncbi:MAG: DUF4876 domain-containing protein [Gemmatimonadales bacterium]
MNLSSPSEAGAPPPPPGGGGGGGGGSVQRASLTVRAVVVPQDAPIADAVGSPGGVLRNAAVTIRLGTLRFVDTTDANGVVTFAQLVPGEYSISVSRLLTPEETAMLPPDQRDVGAFGGGVQLRVNPPATQVSVDVAAGRRGSLVFSELFLAEPAAVGGAFARYVYGYYLELRNNTDTVISLTGKLIGQGFTNRWESTNPNITCATLEPWRLDTLGMLAIWFDAFPQAELQPGQTVLVATDAIDHSTIQPGMPSLTHANFEFIGSNDVDNPGVRNMVRVSPKEYAAGIIGHGFSPGEGVVFLADSVALEDLDLVDVPVFEPRWYRIPRSKILDIVTTDYATELAERPACNPMIPAMFDRGPAPYWDWRAADRSIQRKVLTALPDGRDVLLRTGSTVNDFIVEPRRH